MLGNSDLTSALHADHIPHFTAAFPTVLLDRD